VAEQMVDAAALDAFRLQRPGGRQPLRQRGFGVLGEQQSPQPSRWIGQCRRDCVLAIQPHRAARRVGAWPRSGLLLPAVMLRTRRERPWLPTGVLPAGVLPAALGPGARMRATGMRAAVRRTLGKFLILAGRTRPPLLVVRPPPRIARPRIARPLPARLLAGKAGLAR